MRNILQLCISLLLGIPLIILVLGTTIFLIFGGTPIEIPKGRYESLEPHMILDVPYRGKDTVTLVVDGKTITCDFVRYYNSSMFSIIESGEGLLSERKVYYSGEIRRVKNGKIYYHIDQLKKEIVFILVEKYSEVSKPTVYNPSQPTTVDELRRQVDELLNTDKLAK